MRLLRGDKGKTLAILKGVNLKNEEPLEEKEVEKIVDSVASRQGIDELGFGIGLEFSQIEIIDYPMGIDKRYRFFVVDIDQPVTCEAKEVVDINRLRVKILMLTNRIIKDIKRPLFFELLEKALKEATVIKASLEETDHGVLVQAISRDIKRDYEKPENMVHGNAVIYNGMVIVKMSALQEHLSHTPLKFLTSKKIGVIMRDLKFVRKNVRMNGQQFKAYTCPLDQFKEMENSEKLDEI